MLGVSLCVFAVAVAGMVMLVMRFTAAAQPPRRPALPSSTPVNASIVGAPNKAPAVATAPTDADYAVIVKRDLFRSLAVTPPAPGPVKTARLPILSKPVRVAEPPPFAMHHDSANASTSAVAFTGLVIIAGTQYALLESVEDHVAKYVRKGGSAFGFTLKEITEQAVTLDLDGQTIVLNLGDNKTEEATSRPQETPPANAAGNTNTNQPERGAAGGAPGGMPNGMPPGMPNGGNPGQYRRSRRQPAGG